MNNYKKKYNDILILAAYKAWYDNPGDCPKGYRVPTLKEFEVLYNENYFDGIAKFIKDDSIIYNEEKTLEKIIAAVENADVFGLEKEIVLVNDCSRDKSKA